MDNFRNIGITGRDGEGVAESLEVLIEFLLSRNLKVILGEKIAPVVPDAIANSEGLIVPPDI